MADREDVLKELKIGARVAEEEANELEEYFVETDQFRRILAGEVDIIFGPKGSGKSAIYSSVLNRADQIFDQNILLVAGENPKGATAFAGIVPDPPTSQDEFKAMWKLYILSLISDVLDEYGVVSDEAKQIRSILSDMNLTKGPGGLSSLVHKVARYLGENVRPKSVEAGVNLDPATGAPTGVVARITLREPTLEQRNNGLTSIDDLLALADMALLDAGYRVWILFDRLDVAFEGSSQLEASALRSLFRVYLDLLGFENIQLKIFMRSDIWASLTSDEGFREASHITRSVNITWTNASLLSLVVRRLVKNASLLSFLGTDAAAVLSDAASQRAFFDSIVPDQIDAGKNRPKTFEWLLSRVRDGTGETAPRELIHLLTESRNQQIAMIERRESDTDDERLLSRQAVRGALPEVSRVRLEQTIYAEYPQLKGPISSLVGQKSEQTPATLAKIWVEPLEVTKAIAGRLHEIGFFEERGEKSDPRYWVPFLYRPALKMPQGSAE